MLHFELVMSLKSISALDPRPEREARSISFFQENHDSKSHGLESEHALIAVTLEVPLEQGYITSKKKLLQTLIKHRNGKGAKD